MEMPNMWSLVLIVLNLMSNIRPSEIETCKIKQQIIDVDESNNNSSELLIGGNCCWFSLPKTKTRVITTQEKWYFICAHHSNISETLDDIIQNDIPNTNRSSLNLVIDRSQFPNFVVASNWYGPGDSKFSLLEFRDCEFDYIEEGAFDHTAFKSLYTLIFKNNIRPLECKSGGLIGLTLASIEFINTTIYSMDYDFLWPVHNLLTQVTAKASLASEKSFIHFLGGVGLPMVRMVLVQNSTAMSVLHYRNLFGIQNVTNMELSSCGLESIEERSFDHISRTLMLLNLDDNRFITLPNTIYDELLRSRSIASVFMERNPLTCDCDLSMLIIKIEGNDGFHMSVYTKWPLYCENYYHEHFENCSHISNATTFGTNRSCFSFYGTNFLNVEFPRFNIWSEEPEADIMIKSMTNSTRYYSLQIPIETHGRTIDIRERALEHIHCAVHRSSEVNLTAVRKDVIIIVCVLDTARKTMIWPMNCRSFPFEFEGEPGKVWMEGDDIMFFVPIFTSIYLLSICFGLCLGYVVTMLYPKLLKGHYRVVITKDRARGKMVRPGYTVFVMPSDWINPRRHLIPSN